jgi:hypothetical protein
MKKRGTEEITSRNGLGMISTNRSEEIHQDLRGIWMGERGGVAGQRRKKIWVGVWLGQAGWLGPK